MIQIIHFRDHGSDYIIQSRYNIWGKRLRCRSPRQPIMVSENVVTVAPIPDEKTKMDLKDLSQKMQQFVEIKGWYQPASLRPQTGRNIAISLCLESAEVLEHFQWSETCKDPAALAEELADVQLYLLQLAAVHNIDLEKAVLSKLEKNQTRSWDGLDEK